MRPFWRSLAAGECPGREFVGLLVRFLQRIAAHPSGDHRMACSSIATRSPTPMPRAPPDPPRRSRRDDGRAKATISRRLSQPPRPGLAARTDPGVGTGGVDEGTWKAVLLGEPHLHECSIPLGMGASEMAGDLLRGGAPCCAPRSGPSSNRLAEAADDRRVIAEVSIPMELAEITAEHPNIEGLGRSGGRHSYGLPRGQ